MWFARKALNIIFYLRKLYHFIGIHTEVYDLAKNRLPSVIFKNINVLIKKGEVDGNDEKLLLAEDCKSL